MLWNVFLLLLALVIYIGVGAIISFCIWYMLLIFLKPLKIERLFDIEIPVPMAISLLCIGICYGHNVNDFIKHQNEVSSKPKNKSVDIELEEKEIGVYICTGVSSKRYHCYRHCKGLTNCTDEIEKVSEEEAEDMGRTPCKICY